MRSRTTPLLQAVNIWKSFFGVPVLRGVNVEIRGGEVLAILGQNGAGKSTLVKVLNGHYTMDDGQILIDGRPVIIRSPREAASHGIAVIHQEAQYAPELSVAENMLLGRLPRGPFGRVDWQRAYGMAQEMLTRLGVRIDPLARMGAMSAAERQLVQIARAVAGESRFLIMDEPTSAISRREVETLFALVRSLKASGTGIVYITHRLDEVFEIADRVLVLRDGEVVGTAPLQEVSTAELVRWMIGKELAGPAPTQGTVNGSPVLVVRGITSAGRFSNVSFSLSSGEILGLFGLIGSGHNAVAQALFGVEPVERGEIWLHGKQVTRLTPGLAKRNGVGYVPADRKVEGLLMPLSVTANVTLANLKKYQHRGFLRRSDERASVARWIGQLEIRMSGSLDDEVRYLSGGNQQKVVLARWLDAASRILILNEPTIGVDVGARADVYQLLNTLRAQGVAILLASSDAEEVLALADRIVVMREGRVAAALDREEASQAKLGALAAGAVN